MRFQKCQKNSRSSKREWEKQRLLRVFLEFSRADLIFNYFVRAYNNILSIWFVGLKRKLTFYMNSGHIYIYIFKCWDLLTITQQIGNRQKKKIPNLKSNIEMWLICHTYEKQRTLMQCFTTSPSFFLFSKQTHWLEICNISYPMVLDRTSNELI